MQTLIYGNKTHLNLVAEKTLDTEPKHPLDAVQRVVSRHTSKPLVAGEATYRADAANRALTSGGTLESPFKHTINDHDVEILITSNAIANRAYKCKVTDSVSNWFTVESKVEGLAESITAFNEEFDIQRKTERAMAHCLPFGSALWHIRYTESADISEGAVQILERPVNNPQDITAIEVISRKDIVEYVPDTVDWEHVKIKIGVGTPVAVDRTRMVPFTQLGRNGEASGVSMFEGSYNTLVTLMNLEWAFGESAFRHAGAVAAVLVPKEAPPEVFEFIRDYFHNLTITDIVVLQGDGYKFDSVWGVDAINPEPYKEFFYPLAASAVGVPEPKLFGTKAGAVIGSEWNFRDYASDITGIQRNIIGISLRELYSIAQDTGQIIDGDYKIMWEPILTETRYEQQERAQKQAQYLQMMMAATQLGSFNGILFDQPVEFYLDDTNIAGLRYIPNPTPEQEEAQLALPEPQEEQPEPAAEPEGNPGQEGGEPTSEKKSDAKNKWLRVTGPVEDRLLSDVLAVFSIWEADSLLLAEQVGSFNDESRELKPGTMVDQAPPGIEFYDVDINILGEAIELRTVEAWDMEANQIYDNFNAYPETLPTIVLAADPLVQKNLKDNALERSKLKGTEYEDKIKEQLHEGNRLGEGAEKMTARIQSVWDASKADAMRLARTEIVIASADADVVNYRANGVTKVDYILGPGPCPNNSCIEAAAKSPYMLEEINGVIPVHPHCFCDFMPIDITEEV